MRRIILFLILFAFFSCLIVIPIVSAQVVSKIVPKLAFDCIRGDYFRDLDSIAKALGFETRRIEGNAIVESDLADIDILVLYELEEPYFSSTEKDLILDFVERGGGL